MYDEIMNLRREEADSFRDEQRELREDDIIRKGE